ncbi:MAG: hypothetical protein KTR14_05510 [Vampirovibrio sp.]|nr:hypothetical protein [Vampirovibrio sp.]
MTTISPYQGGYSTRPSPVYASNKSVYAAAPASSVTPQQISDKALLAQYQPVLLMNPLDDPPVAIEDLLKVSTLKKYLHGGKAITLIDRPTLNALKYYNAPNYFLSFSTPGVQNALKQGAFKPTIYGKVIETPHFKALYYLYYFPQSGLSLSEVFQETPARELPQWVQKPVSAVLNRFPITAHEGDVEGSMVFLQKHTLKPTGMLVLQHFKGQSVLWKDIQQIQNHPAIRLRPFSHATDVLKDKNNIPSLRTIHPDLKPIGPDNDLILTWRGRIGDFRRLPWLYERGENLLATELLPSVTGGYRGPGAGHVTPWEVSLALNAVRQPEKAFYHYLDPNPKA